MTFYPRPLDLCRNRPISGENRSEKVQILDYGEGKILLLRPKNGHFWPFLSKWINHVKRSKKVVRVKRKNDPQMTKNDKMGQNGQNGQKLLQTAAVSAPSLEGDSTESTHLPLPFFHQIRGSKMCQKVPKMGQNDQMVSNGKKCHFWGHFSKNSRDKNDAISDILRKKSSFKYFQA